MQGYEAMTLGSPTTSYPSPNSSSTFHPSNLPHPSSPNSKSRFQDNTPRLLPSYLMGDYQNRGHTFSHTLPTNPSTTPTQPPTYHPNHHPSSYERPRSQHTGPPLQTLEESFFNKRTSNTLEQSSRLDSSQLNNNTFNNQFNNNQFSNNFPSNNNTPNYNNTPNNYLINKTADSFSSPVSMGRKDPMYNIIDNNALTTPLQHCWITVFGFPNDATSSILQEFSALGTVLKHIIPETGNWVHILYESKIQARRALSRHGRVLGGCLMIGVAPCTDKSVTSNDTHRHTLNNNTLNLSNANNLDRALNGEPRKTSTGIISKTIDYVFGWS